jgi:L-fuculose-phosphate aldolase
MAEVYTGTKFDSIRVQPAVPCHPLADRLIHWCRRFAALGLAGKAMGNLSFRTDNGFVITPTGTDPLALRASDLVEVLGVDVEKRAVYAAGARDPSSESMMHHAIYRARPGVMAIFHGHSGAVLKAAGRFQWPVTAHEQPYGTPEMAAEVVAVLGDHPFVIMRNHGFIALGASMDEAGRVLENVLEKLAT